MPDDPLLIHYDPDLMSPTDEDSLWGELVVLAMFFLMVGVFFYVLF